jgi:hypothetical protein
VGSGAESGSMGDVHDDGTSATVADDAADQGVPAGAEGAGTAGGADAAGGAAAAGAGDEAGRRPGQRGAGSTSDRLAGDVVIRADLAGTLLFGVTAALAAILFTSVWQWIAAITALSLFAIGVFAFLWSYYNAVQRSRTDVISVSGLYFLLGDPTPARVRRVMLGTLLLQLVIALVTTLARSQSADGRPGTSLALGFLVPMLGFGLNGLWAAYHADFPSRETFEDREGL